MTVEIANRLVELRKQRGFSQEDLAEKLGLSRQAISKWERAEASPDTDNLILLSRLYGISLDELLNADQDTFNNIVNDREESYSSANQNTTTETDSFDDGEDADSDNTNYDNGKDYVHVGFNGVHVKDDDSEVHIGWDGIHVTEKGKSSFNLGKKGVFVQDGDENVTINNGGVFINGEEYDYKHSFFYRLPFNLCAVIAYIVLGMQWGLWHPGWLVFFLPPILSSILRAIKRRDVRKFNYPCLATLIFLSLGIFYSMWYISWVVFLTVPVFYAIFPSKKYRDGVKVNVKVNMD